jgi:hypothetical protein
MMLPVRGGISCLCWDAPENGKEMRPINRYMVMMPYEPGSDRVQPSNRGDGETKPDANLVDSRETANG